MMRESRKTKTYCIHCHLHCPLVANVQDGRVTGVTGAHCEKGRYTYELMYHPNRILHPLKRVGEKGEGKWKQISVDEALDEGAKRLKGIKDEYGPTALATSQSTYNRELQTQAGHLFSALVGTPHILTVNYKCVISDILSQWCTFGDAVSFELGTDMTNAKTMVMWGCNVWDSRPAMADAAFANQKKGAKLIHIDPRETEISKHANIWLPIRPGTDAALALAMINYIIENRLYDGEWIKKWTYGFDKLAEHVKPWSIEKAAEVTWLDKTIENAASKIEEATRLIALNKPTCFHTRMGTGGSQVISPNQSRSVACLIGVVGCIDVDGGNFIFNPEGMGKFRTLFGQVAILRPAKMWGTDPGDGSVEAKRHGYKEYPFCSGHSPFVLEPSKPDDYLCNRWGYHQSHVPTLLEAIRRGEVKGWFNAGANICVHYNDPLGTQEALKKLDFYWCNELFMTPTAVVADIVFPACHFFETEHPVNGYGIPRSDWVGGQKRVVEPQGEAKDDREIVIELCRRMGIKVPWKDAAAHNDWRVEGLGLTYKELLEKPGQEIHIPIETKKYEKWGRFDMPTGKVELYSTMFEKAGYPPLPSHEEAPESPVSTPDVYREYPFILVTHRERVHDATFTWHPGTTFRKKVPDQVVEINRKVAEERGINNGDWVRVERKGFSRVLGKARLTNIQPQTISMAGHCWYPEKPGPDYGVRDYNPNMLTDNRPPYSYDIGCPQNRNILVRFNKVQDRESL